jgi:hypothetical protein
VLRHALAGLRRIRANDDRQLTTALHTLGLTLRDLGQLVEAESLLHEAEALYRTIRGDRNWTVGAMLCDRAALCRLDGRAGEADMLEAEAAEIFRHSPLWVVLPNAIRMEINARHAQNLGAYASAAESWRRAIAIRQVLCPDHSSLQADIEAEEACTSLLAQN